MRCERFAFEGGDPEELAAQLRSLIPAAESVRAAVEEIVGDVRARGDQAVIEYTTRFDGSEVSELEVRQELLDDAATDLDQTVRVALDKAIENVGRVAGAALHADKAVRFDDGHQIVLREAPVRAAAVYVPGGRAPYPSTVVMGVVTARVAGVPHVAVCAPPSRDGDVDPVVLAACRLAGASVVYRMGGAQAIAALAYGTQTVPAVDVIVGPGNLYVQEAKRQVFGQVGIEGFAGPSDLVVVAGADAEPSPLALDLLAQAEHGTGTIAIAISYDERVLDAIATLLDQAPDTGAVTVCVRTASPTEALALAQAIAPEHLQLVGREIEALAPVATRAGCVFVGAASGTAFGDYIAGSNHILPTAGAARFASALSPAHFRRSYSEVRIGTVAAARALAAYGVPLARAEGFERHAESMEARIRENGER